MPPSRPYYELQGVYRDTEFSTKTLIFSSWEMVPRMLACMLSYEAERRTVGKLAKDYEDRDVHYFYTGEKRYPSARMNFSVRNGSPYSMTLFCLVYCTAETNKKSMSIASKNTILMHFYCGFTEFSQKYQVMTNPASETSIQFLGSGVCIRVVWWSIPDSNR